MEKKEPHSKQSLENEHSSNQEQTGIADDRLHYSEDGELLGIAIDEDMTIEEFLQLAVLANPSLLTDFEEVKSE